MNSPKPAVAVVTAPRSDTWARLWSLLLRPVETTNAQASKKPAKKD